MSPARLKNGVMASLKQPIFFQSSTKFLDAESSKINEQKILTAQKKLALSDDNQW